MKAILATILSLTAALMLGTAHAQPRSYDQAELDSLLAPIALHPDGVVSQILIAATYPEQVADAARWSRANPHFSGDAAVRAVQNEPWDPAVKALVAFPDLLARMGESPQWLHDLGEAFLNQEVQVMDTVQALRQRAQAAGHLSSNDQYVVYPQGEAIVVYPRTHYVYVNYYDPYLVYGPWWWPYYRPVFWRPWAPRPVFVTHGFFYSRPDWYRRHIHVVHRPAFVHHQHHHVVPGKWRHRDQPDHRRQCMLPEGCGQRRHAEVRPHVRLPESQRQPIVQSVPLPAPTPATRETWTRRVQAHTRLPESRRQPIVQSTPLAVPSPATRETWSKRVQPQTQPMPAASGFTQHHPQARAQNEMRREQRGDARREQQHHPRGHQPRWQRS